MIKINNVFSAGHRCTTDNLLDYMNIRKYSGPFSYMVIDCETSLEFIENRFDSFLDFTYVNNTKYYWCENLWHPKLFFNNKYLPTSKSDIELNKWDKICVWTGSHHNMFEESTKIKKRCERLLNIIDNKPSSLLLVCMPNIKEYSKLDNRQSLDFYINFTKKNKINLLLLVPLHNFNHDPLIVYNKNNLLIVYFNSYYEKNGNAFTDKRIKWDLIIKIINEHYIFVIDPK